MAEPADDGVDGDGEEEIPFIEKIAIVMVALGEEVSGEVMKHLSDYEIEKITQAIAGLKNLSIEVWTEFLRISRRTLWLVSGLVKVVLALPVKHLSEPSALVKRKRSLTDCRHRSPPVSICCATSPRIRSRPLLATSTRRVLH